MASGGGMSALMDILSMVYGGDHPEANPNFTDSYTVGADGAPTAVDSSGQPLSPKAHDAFIKAQSAGTASQPYKPITGPAAYFSGPAAQYVAEQNANYAIAPQLAQRASDIQTGISANKYGQVRQALSAGTPVTDPNISNTQAAIMLGNNPTAQNVYDVNSLQAKMAAGVPLSSAEKEAYQNQISNETSKGYLGMNGPQNTGMAQGIGALNSLNTERYSNAANLPYLSTQASANDLVNRSLEDDADRPNIGNRAYLSGLDTANKIPIEQQASTLMPNTLRQSATASKLGTDLSNQRLQMEPALLSQAMNEQRRATMDAANIPPPSNKYQIDSKNQLGLTPNYINPFLAQMQAANGMLDKNGNIANPISAGNFTPTASGLLIGPSPGTETQGTNGASAIAPRQVRAATSAQNATEPATNNVPSTNNLIRPAVSNTPIYQSGDNSLEHMADPIKQALSGVGHYAGMAGDDLLRSLDWLSGRGWNNQGQ